MLKWESTKTLVRSLVATIAALAGLPAAVVGAEDTRTAIKFLNALRERGYYDLSADYAKQLREHAELPQELKTVLDYEDGKTLLEESTKTGDLVKRRDLLEQARIKFENFTKANPNHPLSQEAFVQNARLLVERGHLAMIQAEDASDAGEKNGKIGEARSAFDRAREAYKAAITKFESQYSTYPKSIPESDPRWAQRDRVHSSLLSALLQKAEVDYEQAQTYPAGSKERGSLLEQGHGQFDSLHKNYRETLAGLTAQMWQAKCLEEQGKIDEAIGLYKELLGHLDPRLRALQSHVGAFYIEAIGKRKQYALAADEAVRWFNTYNRPEDLRSENGLRVHLQLAKNIHLQMPEIEEVDRPKAAKRIVDNLAQVIKYASPYKQQALEILKQYKPSIALKAEELAKLNFEETTSQAEEALNSQDWSRAINLFRASISKARGPNSADQINLARYNLAFAYYSNKQFYEAFVLADHLARRHPKFSLAPKATGIGMRALVEAYDSIREVDRLSDLDRLRDLATYTVTTWSERDEADDARIYLGKLERSTGNFPKAIEVFGAVRSQSPLWLEAQTELGITHWSLARTLARKGDQTGGEAETRKASQLLESTLKAREEAGAQASDPQLISNAYDLAFILTESGKPNEALAILEPIAREQPSASRLTAPQAKLMEGILRARIAANQVDKAIEVMLKLEKSGGEQSQQAQNYFKLGRLIEKELDRLRQSKKTDAESRMLQAYRAFLTTLAGSKTGQTYESLEWAGESLVSIGAYPEAETVLKRVLNEFAQGHSSSDAETAHRRLFHTRLKLASALRGQRKLDEAGVVIDALKTEEPKSADVRFEEGLLFEARAAAQMSSWSAAYVYWQKLAQQLSRIRPRPPEYYEAWYHAAHALNEDRQGAKARQTLAGVMKLSPGVGSPAMKAKYEELLSKIK